MTGSLAGEAASYRTTEANEGNNEIWEISQVNSRKLPDCEMDGSSRDESRL